MSSELCCIDLSKPRLGRETIIDIGMHRSRTSAIAGSLQRPEEQLGNKLYYDNSRINSKDYFEHRDITDAIGEILLSMRSAWEYITR